jgi:hypothetical protein
VPAKLTKDDEVILRHFANFYLLTPSELQALTGRHIVAIRRRLQTLSDLPRKRVTYSLEGLGYLRSIDPPENKWGERIWYPAQSAFDLAYESGWVSNRIHAVERKRSNNKLVHDRLVVQYHFNLWKKYGPSLGWTQHHHNLYERWGEGPDDHVLADGFFYLESKGAYPSFFLEVENTSEHHYEDRRAVSARVRKAESFVTYLDRGLFQDKFRYPDFRVIFLLSTPRKARNFAAKLHDLGGALDSRKFWITDYESAFSGEESIYITPKDFEQRTYSLSDAQLL